jgi:protein-disulfide isomerase
VAHNPTVQAPKRRDGKAKAVPAAERRPTPRLLAAIVAVGAVVLAGILIGVSVAGSGGSSAAARSIAGTEETQALFQGIPQHGLTVGDPKAPVTLVEYGDLQCPICRAFAVETLPTIVRDYVRTGKVRLEFRGLAFIGPDSQRALQAVVAAGAQNRGWNLIDLLYRNQGEENSGWASDATLTAAAKAIPGLLAGRWLDDRGGAATRQDILAMRVQAESLMGEQIRTPSFEVGRTGQPTRYLPIGSLDASAFTPTLDRLLQR